VEGWKAGLREATAALLAALACAICAAAPASASVFIPDISTYYADAGETNHVVMTYRSDIRPAGTAGVLRKTPQIEVVDPGVQILPERHDLDVDRDALLDCIFLPGRAICQQTRQMPAALPAQQHPYSFPFDIWVFDGDDSVRSVTDTPDELVGGEGDDRLIGGDGRTTFLAGPGRDDMWGGYGDDLVLYDHYRFYDGSFGQDLSVTLDNVANDGYAGEHDNVHGDIEGIESDAGDDVLVGNWRDNEIVGAEGNDEITGGAGRDVLEGYPGNDTINAVDGEADRIDCGNGEDAATIDPIDTIVVTEGPATGGCESVTTAG